jgi:hypothetical protein
MGPTAWRSSCSSGQWCAQAAAGPGWWQRQAVPTPVTRLWGAQQQW